MSRRTTRAAAAGVTLAAATALAARRAQQGWEANDGDGAHVRERLLPVGTKTTVKTDDGAELAVTIAGAQHEDAPTVVLAHCWGGGREVWAPVAHRLIDKGHRVVMYDQRGHGSSTSGSDGYTIPRLGADLKAVVEETAVRHAVLAGHSMGGMTVQSLAAHHPEVVAERARAIVLVATAAAGLSQGSARLDAAAQKVIAHRSVDRALRSRVGHVFVRSAVGAAPRLSDITLTRDLFVACEPDIRADWLGAMLAMDLRDGIAGIGVPTTVMIGTRDTLTPIPRAQEMVERIPNARLVKLKGKGHMLPLEAPDEVAEEIAAK